MEENWDRFPSNIGETMGIIEREPFIFHYNRFEVWGGGSCIYSGNSDGIINAQLNDGVLNVTIDDSAINEHIVKNFSFKEISTNNDRIMWSKDIFNTSGHIEKNNPDISSLFFKSGVLSKVTYTIHDPNTLIEFYSNENISIKNEPKIIALAQKANNLVEAEQLNEARQILVQIYRSIKSDPGQLKDVINFSPLGTAFLMMLDLKLSDDIDNLQMMASVSYLCISKAIEKDNSNINLYKDRLLMLRIGHNPFKYTVMSALNLNAGGFMSFSMDNSDLKARDSIYKMEIADLELHSQLYQQVPFFKERKDFFDEMIGRQFFMPERTLDNIIQTGIDNHKKLLKYLENMVFNQEDVDF